jgi:hypothetical protein
LHIWSAYIGDKQIKTIIERLDALLHRTKLSMDSWEVILSSVDLVQTFHEGDGVRHGVFRMRYRTAPK